MRTVEQARNDIVGSLDHIKTVFCRIRANTSVHGIFNFPDAHKISEGPLLSAWTHWEEFIREVLIIDLATDPAGFLKHDVKGFRVRGAPMRYAEKLLSHPDSPSKFVEWNYESVQRRANTFLSAGHRFTNQLERNDDLMKLKRIRNAVAHKNDKARKSFLDLVSAPPFNLASAQRKGITAGRFVFHNTWNENRVLEESLNVINQSVLQLVP